MSKTSIEVHGWKTDGPVYTTTTRRAGWANRRKRFEQVLHGKRGGRNVAKASFELIEASGLVVLFNKGHVYEVDVDVEGATISGSVDASKEYGVFRIQHGMTLLDVREPLPKPARKPDKVNVLDEA